MNTGEAINFTDTEAPEIVATSIEMVPESDSTVVYVDFPAPPDATSGHLEAVVMPLEPSVPLQETEAPQTESRESRLQRFRIYIGPLAVVATGAASFFAGKNIMSVNAAEISGTYEIVAGGVWGFIATYRREWKEAMRGLKPKPLPSLEEEHSSDTL